MVPYKERPRFGSTFSSEISTTSTTASLDLSFIVMVGKFKGNKKNVKKLKQKRKRKERDRDVRKRRSECKYIEKVSTKAIGYQMMYQNLLNRYKIIRRNFSLGVTWYIAVMPLKWSTLCQILYARRGHNKTALSTKFNRFVK